MGHLNCHFISISLTIFMIMSKTAKYHSMATAYELTGSKAIVGSGISGLWLARLLTDAGQGNNLTVYEKSKTFGGRCATRTSRESPGVKYDTGAQYYSLKAVMESIHKRWESAGVVAPWFQDAKGVPRMKSLTGMSALSKQLASDVTVKQDWKVLKIEKVEESSSERWKIHFEKQDPVLASTVVLTCPVPQAVDILNFSGIPFDAAIADITYAKAICVLFETEYKSGNPLFREKLLEQDGVTIRRSGGDAYVASDGFYTAIDSGLGDANGVYSICDQKGKGLSNSPCWTIIMNPTFSEKYYEEKDEKKILDLVTSEIRKLFPQNNEEEKLFNFQEDSRAMIKKWKFSHPNTIYPTPYCEVSPGLFLAGDGFGAPSMNGAVLSATELASYFLKSSSESK